MEWIRVIVPDNKASPGNTTAKKKIVVLYSLPCRHKHVHLIHKQKYTSVYIAYTVSGLL